MVTARRKDRRPILRVLVFLCVLCVKACSVPVESKDALHRYLTPRGPLPFDWPATACHARSYRVMLREYPWVERPLQIAKDRTQTLSRRGPSGAASAGSLRPRGNAFRRRFARVLQHGLLPGASSPRAESPERQEQLRCHGYPWTKRLLDAGL
jgi:hypothetical protein